MSYTLQEQFNSKNFTPSALVAQVFGYAREVKYITIHHWGNFGQDFNTVRDFLCTNNTPTSAHYIAMDGLVACIVTPDDAAWHAGNARGNAQSVGIECRPEATDGDYRTVAELVRFLRSIYGDVPLVPHNYWYNTACPGNWDLNRLDAMARGSVTAAPAPAPKPAQKPAPAAPTVNKIDHGADELHWTVESGDTLYKIASYYGIVDRIPQIASYNGITVDTPLKVGWGIWIPGRLVWTVEAPDTYSSIAAYYGFDADYLARLNGDLNRWSTIYIGNTVVIQN